MTKVKVCGLRVPSDVFAVNAALPDYAGFIFVPERKRYIRPEEAENLRKALDPRIKSVGVFVNAGTQRITEVLSICHVDLLQLHGQESNEEIDKLRAAAGEKVQIIKAFRIDAAEDLEEAKQSHADFVLLDHGPGGTGESFDWSLIRDFPGKFFLAGGLSPKNVSQAISLTRPYAVDASSSLETDGRKDPEKVMRFVNAVRNSSR